MTMTMTMTRQIRTVRIPFHAVSLFFCLKPQDQLLQVLYELKFIVQNRLLDFIIEWVDLIIVVDVDVDVDVVAVVHWAHRVLASSSSCRLFYEPICARRMWTLVVAVCCKIELISISVAGQTVASRW